MTHPGTVSEAQISAAQKILFGSDEPGYWRERTTAALTAASIPTPAGQVTEEWQPTAENINTLPDVMRRYIHALETRCDPSGDTRELFLLREQNKALRAECASLAALPSRSAPAAEGWQTVPVEPTSEMAIAWEKAYNGAPEGSGHALAWDDAYAALIAAAPQPPAPTTFPVPNYSDPRLTAAAVPNPSTMLTLKSGGAKPPVPVHDGGAPVPSTHAADSPASASKSESSSLRGGPSPAPRDTDYKLGIPELCKWLVDESDRKMDTGYVNTAHRLRDAEGCIALLNDELTAALSRAHAVEILEDIKRRGNVYIEGSPQYNAVQPILEQVTVALDALQKTGDDK